MKYLTYTLVGIVLLLVALMLITDPASAQLKRTSLDSDHLLLVGATPDTVPPIHLYLGQKSGRKGARPTVHLNIEQIGANTTHYWLQIDYYGSEKNIAEDAEGWAPLWTDRIDDWNGYRCYGVGGNTNDFDLALPWLDAYSEVYLMMVLSYPNGSLEDSTYIEVVYTADQSHNMNAQPENRIKNVTHYDMYGYRSPQLILGASEVVSAVVDLKIPISPNRYDLPSRGVLTIAGVTEVDNDTLDVYVYEWFNQYGSATPIDTLEIILALNHCGQAELSFTLNEGTGFVESVKFVTYARHGAGSDSTWIFGKLLLTR